MSQQKNIMNYFKRVSNNKDPLADTQLSATGAPSPLQGGKKPLREENLANQAEKMQRQADRRMSEKRPINSSDLPELNPDDDDSAKRRRVSSAADTPPTSPLPPPHPPPQKTPTTPRPPGVMAVVASPFALFGSPSAAGDKENQLQQFLSAQPPEVQALLVGFGSGWFHALKAEFTKPYFVQLAKFVAAERAASGRVVYPPPGDVFSWTRACRLTEVKVVILGQDPYHGPNQAHGLCFSVRRPTPSPPSLLNIYKEVADNFPDKFQLPPHGDLTGWAEQGVLLLNAVLTVRRGEANSHQGRGWEAFTDAVVSTLNERLSSVVFILWGNYAQKKGARIDKRRHKVICGAHPSPLAVNRGGFFGKMFFKEANDYLKSVSKTPIDWCHLP